MEYQMHYLSPDIKLSQYEAGSIKTETIFEHHMLIWFLSGDIKIVQADGTHYFGAGDIFLIPRHRPATIITHPKNGQCHKAVAMHLTAERLQTFYARNPAIPGNGENRQNVRSFHKHPLLESYLGSLIPYFDLKEALPPDIASLKMEEAIRIVRAIDGGIDDLLADFGTPGKIDLGEFMEKNFVFNMSLEKFGYLTGRSLSTFKRDFKKAYRITPQKWLTQKRLELAHYLLSEKNRKPADLYLEIGFENLSHFSFAFKKRFGYAPTALSARTQAAR